MRSSLPLRSLGDTDGALADFSLDPQAIVALFSQTAAFDSAFTSARTLGVDMSSLFEILTEKCVGLALHGAA